MKENVMSNAVSQIEPQTQLQKTTSTINDAVNKVATDVVDNLEILHSQLDELKAVVMDSANGVKQHLIGHANICLQAQQEIARITRVIAEIRVGQEFVKMNGGAHDK